MKLLICAVLLAFSFSAQANFTLMPNVVCDWELLNTGLSLVPTSAQLSRQLPLVRQDTNGKCGPSSLAIALAHFGKIQATNFFDVYELSNLVTGLVHQTVSYNSSLEFWSNLYPPLQYPGVALSLTLNAGPSLAETALRMGLFANSGIATLDQISQYVARQEVVLVHWQANLSQPLEQHWSAVQEINSLVVTLRDPWPTHPMANPLPILDFVRRATAGGLNRFHIVRVADHYLLP
ncbi:MAG: hypothetical protein AB7N80_03760 [Bdellovibrionales bacterium]